MARRAVQAILVTRTNPRWLDWYGHWWVELGEESHGWWPGLAEPPGYGHTHGGCPFWPWRATDGWWHRPCRQPGVTQPDQSRGAAGARRGCSPAEVAAVRDDML